MVARLSVITFLILLTSSGCTLPVGLELDNDIDNALMNVGNPYYYYWVQVFQPHHLITGT